MVRFPILNRPSLVFTQRQCATSSMSLRRGLDAIKQNLDELDPADTVEALKVSIESLRNVEIECRVDLQIPRVLLQTMLEAVEQAMFLGLTEEQMTRAVSRARVLLNRVEREIEESFYMGVVMG